LQTRYYIYIIFPLLIFNILVYKFEILQFLRKNKTPIDTGLNQINYFKELSKYKALKKNQHNSLFWWYFFVCIDLLVLGIFLYLIASQ
jgi:hypothetical protein